MKKLLACLALSQVAHAAPMDWLSGTYYLKDGNEVIEEIWLPAQDGLIVGSSTWTEHGRLKQQELFQIHDGSMDLWILRPDGKSRVLKGWKVTQGNQEVVFRRDNPEPETIVYRKTPGGGLQCVLRKKAEFKFDLKPGRSE